MGVCRVRPCVGVRVCLVVAVVFRPFLGRLCAFLRLSFQAFGRLTVRAVRVPVGAFVHRGRGFRRDFFRF